MRPHVRDFTHGVYYLALDLDELPEVDRRIRMLGIDRRAPLAVRASDHLAAPGESLAGAVRRHLAAEGIDARAWRITLVTNARVLGYIFNPVSFYLCRDGDGELQIVIAEVGNTHGGRHLYTLRPELGASAAFTAQADKDFYVSPFISMDARYRFLVLDRPDGLQVSIHEYERPDPTDASDAVATGADDGRVLTLYAAVRLQPRPLTTAQLARTLLRYPLITITTIALIHWHALRLWRRRLRFYPYGDGA